MKKLLLPATVSATLALAAIPAAAGFTVPVPGTASLAAKVGCWDECEYYYEAIEEAREQAREEAAEAAAYAEEAEEDGYRPRRRARRAVREEAPRMRAVSTRKAEPEPQPAPQQESEKKAEPAPASGKRAVAVNSDGHCKQYFPAVGMTLSVPCE